MKLGEYDSSEYQYTKKDYKAMTEAEALKEIVEEYPEFTEKAIQMIRDGEDLIKLLSILDSFY